MISFLVCCFGKWNLGELSDEGMSQERFRHGVMLVGIIDEPPFGCDNDVRIDDVSLILNNGMKKLMAEHEGIEIVIRNHQVLAGIVGVVKMKHTK